MNKYVKNESISVGFNYDNGQYFFDLLNQHREYIHSYFFSLTETLNNDKLNPDRMIENFKSYETYGIPGNLLLNHRQSMRMNNQLGICDEMIAKLRYIINLKALTVRDLALAIDLKKRYPDLEIHLSVRFWDWDTHPISSLVRFLETGSVYRFIDVINVSGTRSYLDHQLIDKIHSWGCKVKFIVNEGCIINRMDNYNKLPGCEYYDCRNSNCGIYPRKCDLVFQEHPWMILSKINLFKEQLQYYDIDILKISGRSLNINSLEYFINYWASDGITDHIDGRKIIDYNAFLEFCKQKSTQCIGSCSSCQKCKSLYNRILGGEKDE